MQAAYSSRSKRVTFLAKNITRKLISFCDAYTAIKRAALQQPFPLEDFDGVAGEPGPPATRMSPYCPLIVTVNDSLPGLASIPSNETLPVLLNVPLAAMLTLTVIVMLAPLASVGVRQLTVPLCEPGAGALQVVPAGGMTLWKAMPAGIPCVNCTFGAFAPLFWITQV